MYSESSFFETYFSGSSAEEVSFSTSSALSTVNRVLASTSARCRAGPACLALLRAFLAEPRTIAVEEDSGEVVEATMEPPSGQFAPAGDRGTNPVSGGVAAEEMENEETVLMAMRELGTAMKHELQGVKSDMVRMLEMQTGLMGKMVALDATVQTLSESGSTQTLGTGSPVKKGYRHRKLPLLGPTFSDANASIPLLQLACIITTSSLSLRAPQLQGLVSESVVHYLGDLRT